MNFQKIAPVNTSDQLLDLAFSKARKKNKAKKLEGERLEIFQKKECSKLDIVKDNLVARLQNILSDFPSFDSLNNFYNKLVRLTLDYAKLKQSLGAVNWAVGRIRLLHKDYVRRVAKTEEVSKGTSSSKEFYGWISSIIKQINSNLHFLESARRMMKTYPDVKEMFTVCIYGFPNVGKTTLLNQLTTSKGKVAEYAFTTKSINSGFFELQGVKIQVFDVPGTLGRPTKKNNIELQADLVVNELADCIIYVIDLTESCGYSIESQERLLKKIRNKNTLIYISKSDLLPEEISFKQPHYGVTEIKEKIVSLASDWEPKKNLKSTEDS